MHAGVEPSLVGLPPRPRQIGHLVDPCSDRPGVTRGQHGLGEHERDASVIGVGQAYREGEELGGRVGVGSATVSARTRHGWSWLDICDRYGGLPTTMSNRSSPQS